MAVSGSKNFTITRAEIIETAFKKIGVYDQGEAISGADTASASLALNIFTKGLIKRGADIELREDLTLFLQPNQESYTFSSTSTDKYTNDTIVETTLSADEASGQTEISVTSETGMSVSDVIGIKMDDDTIHWSTISSLAPLTIADATDDDAASGNKVYVYTNVGDTPRKILFASRRDTGGYDSELGIIGQNEYSRLSDKDADGPPNQVMYRVSRDSGKLFVWPTDWGSSGDKINLVTNVLPDDFDSASNNSYFSIEWGDVFIYQLAWRLAPEHGITGKERRELRDEAEFFLAEALDADVEQASLIIAARD